MVGLRNCAPYDTIPHMDRLEIFGLFFDPSDLHMYTDAVEGTQLTGTWNAVTQPFTPSDQPHTKQLANPFTWPTAETVETLVNWLVRHFPTLEFAPLLDPPGTEPTVLPGSASVGQPLERIEDIEVTGLSLTSSVSLRNLWRSLVNAGEATTARNLATRFASEGLLL